MSDSLVLIGVKDIRKHTGTEMLRINPTGGGDTFQLKQWWVKGGVSTCYTDATVFNVTQDGNMVKLAIASSMSTNLNISVNDNFQFTFSNFNEVNRAALFSSTFELIEEYVFPRISGGKVMTVIPAGAAVRPIVADPVTFTDGSGAVTGTYEVGETVTITSAPYSGGIGVTTLSNILQSSTNGLSPWTFVTSSPQASFTYELVVGLDAKYLRQSTQVADTQDDNAPHVNNGAAVGPVTS
tara:strand:- start:47 stop:763 length:717 start_codon:yes stop_codon:yes gene_type:complete